MDGGTILIRKIWKRELRALAEGRPLTDFYLPEDVVAKSGLSVD
jgi:hypothetical protein